MGLATLRALGASRGAVDPLLVDAATEDPRAVVGEVRRWEADVAEAHAAASRPRGAPG